MLFKNFFRGSKTASADWRQSPNNVEKTESHDKPAFDPEPAKETIQEPEDPQEKTANPVKDEDVITIHNLLILDESGSMSSIYNAALSGANETIQTVRAAQRQYSNQNHRFTFVTFNTAGVMYRDGRQNIKTIIDDAPITEVRDLTDKDYKPDAATPLYDAMGHTINRLQKKVKDGDRVLVTVITDGMENASQEFSGRMIKDLVTDLREQGWTFVYIGANQDAIEVARDLNINNSLNFEATDTGTGAMYEMHRTKSAKYYRKMSRFGRGYDSEEDFFDSRKEQRVTPRFIDELEPNEVFVFLSNPRDGHSHGAAEIAYQRFGAIRGQSRGPQGQCYAIPSMSSADTLRPYVSEFLEYARRHSDQRFLVYDVFSDALFNPAEVMRLFDESATIPNICLPEAFWHIHHKRCSV